MLDHLDEYRREWWSRVEAEDGGPFAVALAILELADAVHRLGVNDAATKMGAIELLANEVKGLKEAVEDLRAK